MEVFVSGSGNENVNEINLQGVIGPDSKNQNLFGCGVVMQIVPGGRRGADG